ncbi:MAG: zinc ABC transporter substrate-binding protein [Acidobacteriota bacterium]
MTLTPSESRRGHCVSILLALTVMSACSSETAEVATTDPPETKAAPATIRIVTLAPTASWLLTEVAGPAVESTSLWVGEGRELEPNELESLIEADLIVRHGAGLDRWADTLDLESSRLIDLSEGASLIEREGTRHSHGEEGEHVHAEPLTDTWQDVALVLQSLDVLESRLSSPGALSAEKVSALRRRLAALDARFSQLVERTSAQSSEDELAYLVRRLGAEPRDALLQLSTQQAEGSLSLESLLPPPSDGDYGALLERNVERIGAAAAVSTEG